MHLCSRALFAQTVSAQFRSGHPNSVVMGDFDDLDWDGPLSPCTDVAAAPAALAQPPLIRHRPFMQVIEIFTRHIQGEPVLELRDIGSFATANKATASQLREHLRDAYENECRRMETEIRRLEEEQEERIGWSILIQILYGQDGD